MLSQSILPYSSNCGARPTEEIAKLDRISPIEQQLFRIELLPATHILEFTPRDAASANYQYGKLKLLRSFTRLIITVFRITPVHLFNRDQREAAEI